MKNMFGKAIPLRAN